MKMEIYINDGAHVKPSNIAFAVEGKVQSLLQTDCLMLNAMQRMASVMRVYFYSIHTKKERLSPEKEDSLCHNLKFQFNQYSILLMRTYEA